jgi:hypothetical protein
VPSLADIADRANVDIEDARVVLVDMVGDGAELDLENLTSDGYVHLIDDILTVLGADERKLARPAVDPALDPYRSSEMDEARRMNAAAEYLTHTTTVPRAMRAALAHVLYACSAELNHGRPLPVEVRRAAKHLLRVVEQANGHVDEPWPTEPTRRLG